MPTDQREQAEEQRHTNGGEQPAVKEKETQPESAEEASGQRYAETSDGETEEHQHEEVFDAEAEPLRAGTSDDQAEERLHAGDPQCAGDSDEKPEGNDAETPSMPDDGVNRAGISDETFGEQGENLGERHEQEVVELADWQQDEWTSADQQEENPAGPEAAATAVQTRTERRKEKSSSKQRQGEQEEAAAEVQTQTKPLEETAPDEQKRKQQQETGDAADKVTRKQQKKEQKKKQKEEKRRNKKPRRRIFPIWLRIIVVLALSAAALTSGLMIGYGVVGNGNPTDALEWETWQHIIDIVIKQG